MIGLQLSLVATLVAAIAWRGFRRRAPVPVHMLRGGPAWFDVGVVLLGAVGLFVKWLAIVLVGVQGWVVGLAPWQGAVQGLALAGVVAAVAIVARRPLRSCAAPVGEEAAFLGGCASVAAVTGTVGGDGVAALAGIAIGTAAAVVFVGGLAAVFLATWGARPVFVQMRQRGFRILGDNPDALTVVARLRVRGDHVVTVPHMSQGPVTFALYTPAYKRVEELLWATLRPVLEARGGAKIHVGPTPAAGADFSVQVPPGDYICSIRHYRPHHWSIRPTVTRGRP